MRARNIKPGLFKNEDLPNVDFSGRLLFIGLWMLADKLGLLEDRPLKIKGELFPYDVLDVDSLLGQLAEKGFILRYEVDGKKYIQVINFLKHQNPHPNEKASGIPPPQDISGNYVKGNVIISSTQNPSTQNPSTQNPGPVAGPEGTEPDRSGRENGWDNPEVEEAIKSGGRRNTYGKR